MLSRKWAPLDHGRQGTTPFLLANDSQMGSSRINKTIWIDKGLKSYYHGQDN